MRTYQERTYHQLSGTTATGTAKFTLDSQGNMAYELDVKNIKGVIGAHISLQNGTDLAQVFNPYMEIAGKSEIPTGQVSGLLSKGVLAPHDLQWYFDWQEYD